MRTITTFVTGSLATIALTGLLFFLGVIPGKAELNALKESLRDSEKVEHEMAGLLATFFVEKEPEKSCRDYLRNESKLPRHVVVNILEGEINKRCILKQVKTS